jgi:hypothetical protein
MSMGRCLLRPYAYIVLLRRTPCRGRASPACADSIRLYPLYEVYWEGL